MDTLKKPIEKSLLEQCGGFDKVMKVFNEEFRKLFITCPEPEQLALINIIKFPFELKEAFIIGVDLTDYEILRLGFVYFSISPSQLLTDKKIIPEHFHWIQSIAVIREIRQENKNRKANG